MKREFYEPFFKGKEVTVMGLGVLGRGIQVTQFLAECGASITVTDLKDKESLKNSIKALAQYRIRYVLGKHDIKDFENIDLVIKAAGVPLDSQYIKHARAKDVPVVMDASLFAKIIQGAVPRITIIGVTGTRGKSMTTALIYHILKKNEETLGGKIYLGGNMRNKATLPLLKKVVPGDFVVLELDSWQLQGFGDKKLSPHIAVFTNLMQDHLNYYKKNPEKYLGDKSNIYKFQNKNDVFITNKRLLKILTDKPRGKVVIPERKTTSNIRLRTLGTHNLLNTSYAYEATRALGLKDTNIRHAIENFHGLEGRLEYIGKKNGIAIINDNNSTTPEATIAGIKAMRDKYGEAGIILICGGADKGLDLSSFASQIEKSCRQTILLPGTGTELLKKHLHGNFKETASLKSAIREAFRVGHINDVVLFSPGFASFGLFNNEYDRNDQFLEIIRNRKY